MKCHSSTNCFVALWWAVSSSCFVSFPSSFLRNGFTSLFAFCLTAAMRKTIQRSKGETLAHPSLHRYSLHQVSTCPPSLASRRKATTTLKRTGGFVHMYGGAFEDYRPEVVRCLQFDFLIGTLAELLLATSPQTEAECEIIFALSIGCFVVGVAVAALLPFAATINT